MEQTMIQVRVDKDLKERVANVYDAVGLDLPTAIRMFFKKSILAGGLPFDGRVSTMDYFANRQDDAIRRRALLAFETLRSQAAKRPEMTLDEINAEISATRKERRAHD